jgi:hypothetical protein
VADKNGTAIIIKIVPIQSSRFGAMTPYQEYHSRPPLFHAPPKKLAALPIEHGRLGQRASLRLAGPF